MKKELNKSGISLIVLVITIIIMIILAAAIILSLNSSGIIERANKAKQANIEANELEAVTFSVQSALLNGLTTIEEENLKTNLMRNGLKIKEDNSNFETVNSIYYFTGQTGVVYRITANGVVEVVEYVPSTFKVGEKYIILDYHDQYIMLSETGGNGVSANIYVGNDLVTEIPSMCVDFSPNRIIISGTNSNYDGVYEIFSDGYIEYSGFIMAKAESKWVNCNIKDEETCIVIHNNIAYYSSDGNNLYEEILDLSSVSEISQDVIWTAEMLGYDKFASIENGKMKLENIYDLFAIQKATGNHYGASVWHTSYKKYENKFSYSISWDSGVESTGDQQIYRINNDKKKAIDMNEYIEDGAYVYVDNSNYYYDGKITSNIFYWDDYPFAYEDGMTCREWANSKYFNMGSIDDNADWYFIPEYSSLDKLMSSGRVYGHSVNDWQLPDLRIEGLPHERQPYFEGTINLFDFANMWIELNKDFYEEYFGGTTIEGFYDNPEFEGEPISEISFYGDMCDKDDTLNCRDLTFYMKVSD